MVPTHMASPQRLARSVPTVFAGISYEKTPFVITAAVIGVTTAIDSTALCRFRAVTQATSHVSCSSFAALSEARHHKGLHRGARAD
jgi:hypothetical protein